MKESKDLAESVASLKKESDDLKSGMQRLREGASRRSPAKCYRRESSRGRK